jgi:hypothetical protein
MAHTCRRCGQEIPEGGLFYHVKLSAVSGYDGVINPENEATLPGILTDIAHRSSTDLENDVYFEREAIVCAACRKAVIEDFCRQVGIHGGSDKNPKDLLH